MNSNAIHDALANLLKSPINYVAEVGFQGVVNYACVGTHSFFIIRGDLEKVIAEIFYAHVQKLVIDTSPQKVLLVQLSENRESKLPGKLILSCQNRKTLADHIKSAWKTDYMYRLGQVMDLPVFQGDLNISLSDIPSEVRKPKIPKSMLRPQSHWKEFTIKDYFFFIPDEYRTRPNENTFENKKDGKPISKIFIQISDEISLDTLSFMDGREEISLYCEEYANKLVYGENKVWIISSKPYTKRSNLNQDIASYSGWEVHMRTKKKDITVIMMRRKYIPPLLDVFVDFVVVVDGPEIYLDKTALETLTDFPETANVLKTARKVADSIHPTFVTGRIYKELIQKRAHSLYYDEETLDFLKYRLPFPQRIVPKFIACGVAYVTSLLNIMANKGKQGNLRWKEKINVLHKIYDEQLKQLVDGDFDSRIENYKPYGNPSEIIDIMKKQLGNTGKKNDGMYNWTFKIARYLAYCVDGGLLSSRFTLQNLVDFDRENKDGSNEIEKAINFLLHFKKEKQEYDEKEEDFQNKISSFLTQNEKYVYNEKVMINLLYFGYFKNKISENEIYSRFLMFMIDKTNNPFVKTAICSQIIIDQEDKKKTGSGDATFSDIKAVIKPLLYLYQGDNFKLAALAANALTNLASKNNEVKQYVMNEGSDLILSRLKSKEQHSLKATLNLLLYLMIAFTQNIQIFVAKNGLNEMFELLKGSEIVGVWYSDEILIVIIKIIKEVIINMEEFKKKIIENIDDVISPFKSKKPRYKIDLRLIIEIINLYLIKLQEKDDHAIKELAKKLLPEIIKIFKADIYKTKEAVSSFLTFFLGFKHSTEGMKILKENQIEDKIKNCVPDHDKKARNLYKDITGKNI